MNSPDVAGSDIIGFSCSHLQPWSPQHILYTMYIHTGGAALRPSGAAPWPPAWATAQVSRWGPSVNYVTLGGGVGIILNSDTIEDPETACKSGMSGGGK